MVFSLDRRRGAIEETFRGKIPPTVCRLTDSGRQAVRACREHLKRVVDTLPE